MLNAVKHPRRMREGLPAVLEMLHSAEERSVQHDGGYSTGVVGSTSAPSALSLLCSRRAEDEPGLVQVRFLAEVHARELAQWLEAVGA